MTKKEKLLKLMNEIQHITTSIKEIIEGMTPEERAKLAGKIKEIKKP